MVRGNDLDGRKGVAESRVHLLLRQRKTLWYKRRQPIRLDSDEFHAGGRNGWLLLLLRIVVSERDGLVFDRFRRFRFFLSDDLGSVLLGRPLFLRFFLVRFQLTLSDRASFLRHRLARRLILCGQLHKSFHGRIDASVILSKGSFDEIDLEDTRDGHDSFQPLRRRWCGFYWRKIDGE